MVPGTVGRGVFTVGDIAACDPKAPTGFPGKCGKGCPFAPGNGWPRGNLLDCRAGIDGVAADVCGWTRVAFLGTEGGGDAFGDIAAGIPPVGAPTDFPG